MTDSTVEITDPLSVTKQNLRLKDLGDDSFAIAVSPLNALVADKYDYVSLSYTGDNLTSVVFKRGGSGGTTVATLTLVYTGARLDSVTKT
jgi:hypothetical protein